MQASGRMKIIFADLSLVLASFFWGLGFVAMKDALETYPTFWLLVLRFSFSAILMGLIFRRRISGIALRDFRAGAVIGTFLFLGFAAQTLGLNYTTPGKQAFLTATYVVIVPFLSWAAKRNFPGILSFAASAICLAGMGLLTLEGETGTGLGDVLTVVCAFFFACHILAIEHLSASRDPVTLSILQIGTVAVLSLPAALFFESWPGFAGGSSAWSIGYTVVFCTVISFLIQNVAQKHTPSTHAAILLSLESVFGALSGILLLGEVFTLRMAAGCALILAAVLLTETGPAIARVFTSAIRGRERD